MLYTPSKAHFLFPFHNIPIINSHEGVSAGVVRFTERLFVLDLIAF